MGLLQTLLSLLRETRLVAALLLCSILAVLSVIFYFLALRPRRGTTEWMQRLTQSKATFFPAPVLCDVDAIWLPVSMVLSALLRFAYIFLWLRMHLRANPAAILSSASGFIFLRVGLAAALSAGVYLLLRCMFRGGMSAICIASLSGLLISDSSDTLILLVFSLLALYLWMCTDEQSPLLPGAVWLLVSGILFAWASLTCLQSLWLVPFYFAAYVCKQVLRFYRGDPIKRLKRLILSLCFTALGLMVGLVVLFLFYVLLSGRYSGDFLENVRSLSFYKSILPLIKEKVRLLLTREMSFRSSILAKDALLFIFGSLAVIPLLHGLFVLKEFRCAWLLCLADVFALPWLLCGIYLMNLPMLLLLSYGWDCYCRRERSFFLPIYSLLLAGSYIVLLI